MTSNSKAYALIFSLLQTLIPFSAYAIDIDQSQPIEIESDSAMIDDSEGISTYRGNVIIRQGSTKLTADNITVFAQNRSVTQIVANGTPATFKQQDVGTDQSTSGQAEQITYKAEEAILLFSGEAKLAQATNSFSGDRIEYDIMRKAIRAKGDEGSGTRVKIQYFPNPTSNTNQSAGQDSKSTNSSKSEAEPNNEQ